VSVKKTKGKGKSVAKKAAAKKNAPKPKKGKDLDKVREGIDNQIKDSARLIANKVIEVAKTTGQLASAKYLFEAVGLYPANAQSEARPLETTIAHQLLTKMGIPLEPVVEDEDGEVVAAKTAPAGSKLVAAVHEELAERDGEEDPHPENEE
jgi:hypothetical protein